MKRTDSGLPFGNYFTRDKSIITYGLISILLLFLSSISFNVIFFSHCGAEAEVNGGMTRADIDDVSPVWLKQYGNGYNESFGTVKRTGDGGYIIAGYTRYSEIEKYDILLIKTDENGTEEWERTHGGAGSDFAEDVCQTPDGGYIIVGGTQSYGAGFRDIWILKTDGEGNELWNRTFGTDDDDRANSVCVTSDGAYAVVGNIQINAGFNDIWFSKIDRNGTLVWNRQFGSIYGNDGIYVEETKDKGFIILGTYASTNTLKDDIWLLKTNATGGEQWNSTFDCAERESVREVHECSDGDFIIVGSTDKTGSGYSDILLLETDAYGFEKWRKAYGMEMIDYGYSVLESSDNGFVVTGYMTDSTQYSGVQKLWIAKTNDYGTLEWEKMMAGYTKIWGYRIIEIDTFRYIIGGICDTYPNSNDDIILMKFDFEEKIIPQVDPPPVQWWKNYGDFKNDRANSIRQTDDGGYIVIGTTNPGVANSTNMDDPNNLLLKIDNNGRKMWTRTFDFIDHGYCNSIQQSSDGGYIIIGKEHRPEFNTFRLTLLKTDKNGNNEWSKNYPGIYCSEGMSVQEAPDGGYLAFGDTYIEVNNSGKIERHQKAWLIKTDEKGDEQWNRTYGESTSTTGLSFDICSDGGYLLLCYNNRGYNIIKTDSTGNTIWNWKGPDNYNDNKGNIYETADGGAILVGTSDDNNPYGSGDRNIFLARMDGNGEIIWEKKFGGAGSDRGYDVKEINDGGFVLTGSTDTYGKGETDLIIIKTDFEGDKLWETTFGGKRAETGYSILEASDGGIIVAGNTESYGNGQYDFLVLKLAPNGTGAEGIVLPECEITIPETEVYVYDDFTLKGTSSHRNGTVKMVEIMYYRLYFGSPYVPSGWITLDGINEWEFYWNVSGLEYANYLFLVRAFDGEYYSENVELTLYYRELDIVNFERPDCNVTWPPSQSYVSGNVNITGTAVDPDSEVKYVEIRFDYLNKKRVSGTNSWFFEWNTSDLENGKHIIQVRAYDGRASSDYDDCEIVVFVENEITENGMEDRESRGNDINNYYYIILGIVLIIIALISFIFGFRYINPPSAKARSAEVKNEDVPPRTTAKDVNPEIVDKKLPPKKRGRGK